MMTKQGKMSAATAAKTRLSARAAPDQTRSARMPKPPVDNPAVRWQLLIPPVLGVVLAPPRKQGGREIRRGAPFPMRAGRDRSRIGIRRDHPAIKMPGSVAEQWDDDGEPEEERQRSQNQQYRDDQSPRCHRYRVSRNGAERGYHRVGGAGMTVEHQRERNHAD